MALDKALTQESIDAAAADLAAAIAKLIPAERANTTALYEELQNAPSAENYTAKSWAAYQTARDKAEALMTTMFDAEGNPTDANKAAAQESIEKLAAELTAARKALDEKASDGSKTIASLNLEAIRYLAKKYDPDTLTGYTDESMQTLRGARTAALTLADKIDLTEMGQSESQPLDTALRELRKAIYGLTTTSAAQISVKVSVLDANDIYAGYTGEFAHRHNPNTYTASMTLDANASAYDLLSGKSLLKNPNSAAEAVVFLNGELVYGSLGATGSYQDIHSTGGSSTFQSIRLHDKDELTIVWIYPKQVEYSSQTGTYPAYLMDIPDYFRYSTISAPIEVEAGQPFTVSVTSETALPFHTAAGTRAVTGAAVYRSGAAESAEAAATGYVGVNTYAVTDESGKATLTLYNEGYVLLNAFRTDTDEARYTVGASVLVHVKPTSDLAAVKKQLREKLDAVYNDEQHPESVFTAENWQKVQDAYNTALAAIDAAKTSGAAGDAQQKAIQTIKGLQSSADYNNKANLAQFRRLLAQLPDDVTKLDAAATDTVAQLKTCYEAMTVYQRGQLTGREQKKYDAIANAELAPAVSRKLTFRQDYSKVPAADQAALADMIAYLQNNTRADDKYTPEIGGNMQAQLFSFNTTRSANYGTAYDRITEAASLTQNIVACVNPDYAAYLLCRDAAISAGKKDGPGVITGTGWHISDASMTMYVPDENSSNTTRVLGHMTYTVNGTQYAVKSVTVSGLETDTTSRNATFYDTSSYRGRFTTQCNQVIPDTFLQFTTGFDDVTVTVTWAPVGGDTQAAKDTAISRLNTVKNGLTGDGVQAAYDAGVKAIQAASTAAEVDKAYQAAVVAMREAANNYGKVRVIVENTTYSKKAGAPWDGELVDTWVDLSADSTMMSCVAAALETVNASSKGVESGYIASINGLGEFDGSGSAGWMGTLNDWFTNEGFSAFTVKNGKLADGDVIRIMFTSSGYGADLGGTWGNSDTTVKALTVDGAMLTPNFIPGEAGGQYDYTLIIDGESASVKLTPTASNKNFQVKTFLNEKVTDGSEGSSFFKRTESIPVKVGDTIYVGCGAKGWLSMNNQSGNTQSSDGTWYVLHVVSADTGADYVAGLIDDLPAAVKYENYSAAEDAVFAARAAYGILSKTEQSKVSNLAKLEKLEQAIAGFRSVDTLKAQISDLPEADKLSVADSQAVAAAEKRFVALTTEQKDCLTIAEVEKAEAVFAEMKRILEAPIKDAEAKIDAIGEVTLERGEAVLTAQAAFDALTPEQQAQVSNADKLQSAVAKLAALRKAVLTEKLDELYKTTGDFMGTLGTPTVNSIGGEWMVIGLARSGRPVPAGYYDNVVEYVKAKADANERLHRAKVTDNARVILALTSIGKDVTNVGGHNLLKGLDNMAYVQTQGINGPIFTLIALDSHNYPTMGDVTREKLIQVILDAQLNDGGWDLSADKADPDMTAMAIQALAPYYKTNETVKAAVDKALEALSALQRSDGGFGSWGTVNSESCDQVIVALTALGIDPTTDSRFIKNGLTVLDALAGFYVTGGGFRHTAGGDLDGMATEQGYYALAAYYRFANTQTRLYDMSDVTIQTGGSTVTPGASTPATGDTGVLVWVIALPVTALAAAFVLKRKEREE